MDRELLTRPFGPDETRERPGRNGHTLRYIDTPTVIRRLNEACESWSFEIASHEIHGDEVVVLGKLTAGGMTKMAFGGSSVTVDQQGQIVSMADDAKAAASDSLKKCATLLGVGLHLYTKRTDTAGPGVRTAANDRVTTRQLAAIHSACRKRGLGREGLAEVMVHAAGKTNPTELSKTEASAVITELSGSNGGGR